MRHPHPTTGADPAQGGGGATCRAGSRWPPRRSRPTPRLDCGPSTVRNELALLEEHGLLAHPHTSAGRVPTDAGHRYVVDRMLGAAASSGARHGRWRCRSAAARSRRRCALTSVAISRVTRLLAVVSAPSMNTATHPPRRGARAAPELVMVVVITSTGGVSKTITSFERGRGPGTARMGRRISARAPGRLRPGRAHALKAPGGPESWRQRARVCRPVAPAFASLAEESRGHALLRRRRAAAAGRPSARPRRDQRADGPARASRRSAAACCAPRSASPTCTCASAARTSCRRCARWRSWPQATGSPRRKLGTVSVIGPVHMDYAGAIATVREAAHELSRFVEDAYAGDERDHSARPL